MTPLTTELQVEFDRVNKISLIRIEGRLTNESLSNFCKARRRYLAATNARVTIVDLSSVSEFAVSGEHIQHLAEQKPSLADARRLCVIVAPKGCGFGLCRMFQIQAETTRPLLKIVHTLLQAFAAIGIRSPYFEPSVFPAPCTSPATA
jgi:hypothetical protein